MFEGMAASTGVSSPTYGDESPGRECVHGLVSYYNGLAVVEDTSMPVSTKTHVCDGKSTAAALPAPESPTVRKQPEASQSNQELSEAPAAVKCSTAPPSPPKISRSCSLPASKIPPPKPCEYPVHHQSAASSVRKVCIEGFKRTRTSSSNFPTSTPTSYHAPPTPVAARLRSPCTSYAAFAAKIESSQSRLLDFEKDERWEGVCISVNYGKLPPLNPDDLKLPPPPPSAADKVTNTADAISISEVWAEIKAKTREMIMGSSVSGVLSAMRVVNLTMAGCMIALAVVQIIQSDSAFSVMADGLSVIYTIFPLLCICVVSFFALILVGYELRTEYIDKLMRGSFGFMYSPISIFPFGMVGVYGVLVSLAGFANAYFNYFVITKHPSFTRGIPDYTPPEETPAASSTGVTDQNTTLCERVCKKQACAIQFCLQRRNYQESKCADVIKRYYDCCAAATRADQENANAAAPSQKEA
ncbi:hypothetical protein BBJ28_00000876 [Nothophytophthora sp. Chile5]|nr:hypothetical protein BBJ28_00000876 [Nothophytophthora sp. Chile5]